MKYIQGRDNLSATIHVQTDCKQNCNFCINKSYYKNLSVANFAYLQNFQLLVNSNIKEFVITGGEPLENIVELRALLDNLESKIVYINTTLPVDTFNDFLQVCKEYDNIKGVNISRHGYSFDDEQLKNVVVDEDIKLIPIKTRINVVIDVDTNIEKVIKRWSGMDVEVNLRYDFTKVTKEKLNTPDKKHMIELINLGFVVNGVSSCNVCHTTHFSDGGTAVSLHRGLELTSSSIRSSNFFENISNALNDLERIEVNDFILMPDGKLCYDWDGKEVDVESFRESFYKYVEYYGDNGCNSLNLPLRQSSSNYCGKFCNAGRGRRC